MIISSFRYHSLQSIFFILVAILFAFFDSNTEQIKPMFILLVHFYFSLYYPRYTGYFWALINGLLWDLVTGEPLGIHSLILIAITGITVRFHTFKHFSILNQMLIIGFTVMFSYIASSGLNYFNFRQSFFSLTNLIANGILNGLLWIWLSPTYHIIGEKMMTLSVQRRKPIKPK